MKIITIILATFILSFTQINLFANTSLTIKGENGKTYIQPITPDVKEEPIPSFIEKKLKTVSPFDLNDLIKPEKEDDLPLYVKKLID